METLPRVDPVLLSDPDTWVQIDPYQNLMDGFQGNPDSFASPIDHDSLLYSFKPDSMLHPSYLADFALPPPQPDLETMERSQPISSCILPEDCWALRPFQKEIVPDERSKGSPDDDVTSQISRRFGRMRLTEDGKLRYFGATSYFSMLPNEIDTLYLPQDDSIRQDGIALIERSNLQWFPDLEYEQHLTSLYFAWHSPFLNEVQQHVYIREKSIYDAGHDTALYSPALENSM